MTVCHLFRSPDGLRVRAVRVLFSFRCSCLVKVLQLHLALTSETDSMRVSWVTGRASHAPAVRFREAVFADSQPDEAQAARWQVGGPQHER